MVQLNRKTLIAAAITGVAIVTGAQAQVSDDVVRIGVMADQTGPYSGNGGPGSTLAVRMAVEDFGGRVLGKPIEVIVADDQNKPDVGTNIARQWLEQQKVDTIVGGSASAIALSVSNMMRAARKPYLLAGTVSTDLTGKACSPMNVQFGVDTYSMPKAGVRGLVNQGVKTFFFITVEGAFGDSSLAAGRQFIEQSGGSVVGNVKHPLGTTDFSSYLLQAQASKAQAIVIVNAGADQTNALRQAVEYRITRGGQAITVFGMTINAVQAMGLEVAQGLQFTDPMYWDHTPETRAWAKRFMDRNNGVAPTYIMASAYTAASHYLKAVQAAGTDEGVAVMARMKATPINDFSMKNVRIREDGQTIRPVYVVQVKQPSESKGRYDFYQVKGEIAGDQVFRPLADGGCDFIKK
jgi:branched-chain amino acid transport system substrate-binding protein